jgi:hypothetical protein
LRIGQIFVAVDFADSLVRKLLVMPATGEPDKCGFEPTIRSCCMPVSAITEGHTMLYVVTEEIWTRDGEVRMLRSSRPLFAGDNKAANEYAEKRAGVFDYHGLQIDAYHRYWWGWNGDERVNHRFVIRPASEPK